MKILLAAVALFTLSACATAPTAPLGPANLFKAGISDASSPARVDEVFYSTLADCQLVLTGLERRSDTLKWWGVGLQLAGGIVGSIVLPAVIAAGTAAKSTVAALGGFAGFTNTAISTVREEGLGASDVIRTRISVQAGMQAALAKYFAARDAEPLDRGKAAAAIGELKTACVSYWLASPVK
jgi:hypothetical protein